MAQAPVMDDAQLQTVWQQRQIAGRIGALAEPLSLLMNRTLKKRVKQLGQLAAVWDEVVPESLLDHTALETFHRGVLTVLVDTASHRYQLNTLLRGGLQREIQHRFAGALNRIKLVPGQFYTLDRETGQKRYHFE